MSGEEEILGENPNADLDLYGTLVSLNALLKMEGPLADLAKSGLILIPIGDKGGLSRLTKFAVGVVLKAFLSTHRNRREDFFFAKNFGGFASVAVGSGLYAPEQKACLLRAAENVTALASGIRQLPQPIVVLEWNARDEEIRDAVRKIAHAIVAGDPAFKLFEHPDHSAMYLSNHKMQHEYFSY